MNATCVYVILLLLITCSHISGIPVNRQLFNTKRQNKGGNNQSSNIQGHINPPKNIQDHINLPKNIQDHINLPKNIQDHINLPKNIQDHINLPKNIQDHINLPKNIQDHINLPKKTVKDVIQKFIVGNFDLKQLNKVGNDVFEYIDDKSKLSEDELKETFHDSGHKKLSNQKHDGKRTNRIKEKAKETESKKHKTRGKKLKRKHNRNNKNIEQPTDDTPLITTTLPSDVTVVPANRIPPPPPLRDGPLQIDDMATTTVKEQNQDIEDVNEHLTQSESRTTTPFIISSKLTLPAVLDNSNNKDQPLAESEKAKNILGGFNNGVDEPDASVISTNKHSFIGIPSHSSTSSSFPSYSSNLLSASSTWKPSISSSIRVTSTSVISTSSIHITSSISSFSSSSSFTSSKSALNIPHQSSTTASSSSTSSSILLSLIRSSKPLISEQSPGSLTTQSSSTSTSSTTVSALNSSSFIHTSSTKSQSSSSIQLSSLSSKPSSTTVELFHGTSSSHSPTEQTSSTSSSLP